MGIFSVLEERAVPGPADDFWYEPLKSDGTYDVNATTALTNTSVWAAVNLISGTLGSLPLITYSALPDGGKRRARNLGLYDLFRWSPNKHQTAQEFFEMGQGHLCLRGNFFARLETTVSGELSQIVPLHPDRVTLSVEGDEVLYHYRKKGGEERTFPSSEVLHVKGLSSDGLIGYSPITVGAGAIAMSFAAEKYGSRFFENSATPSGILSHPGKLRPEARSNIKQSWSAAHGSGKQHSVALLEEGLEWKALSVSPEQAQFLQTRKLQSEEIARLWNVPVHLLQILDRSTFNNVVEQNRSFATNNIRMWAIRWEQAIRKTILTRFAPPGTFVEFNMDDLLRPATKERAEAAQIQLLHGALSINEWRARERLNPIEEGGDTHWMPLNIAPVGSSAAPPPGTAPTEASQKLINELRDAGFEVSGSMSLPALRSLSNRRKIAEAVRPLIQDTAQRLVNKEIKMVSRMIKAQLNVRGSATLFSELEEFYHGEFTQIIIDFMLPVIRSYAIQVYGQAAGEMGYPDEFTEELQTFIEDYVAVISNHHAKNSRQQLQTIISRSTAEEMFNDLEVRLAHWKEKRAEKIAREQAIEGGGAFAKFGYMAAGALSLRWITAGETCPFCKSLSGKIVGMQTMFVQSGQTVETEEGKLTPTRSIGHPPLHNGCDCFISPSL
jgi:HK97 family phage portal protein